MKYKYQFMSMHLFESKALENYFQVMAEKGWQVDRLRNYYIRFKKCEPQKLYYYIGFNEKLGLFELPYAEGKNNSYTAFMESFGYQYISSIGMAQAFVSERDNALFTEPEIDEIAFRKATFKDELSKSILTFGLFCFLFLSQLINFSSHSLADNFALANFTFISIFIVYAFILMVPYIRYCRHRNVDNIHVHFQARIYEAILPILAIICFLSFAVPGYLTGLFITIILCILIMRGLLGFIINRVTRKRLWTIIIIGGFSLVYMSVMIGSIDHIMRDQETVEVSEKPFMSAKDLQKQVIDPYMDSDESILLSRQYYSDSEITYDYYQIKDTFLQSFCLNQILRENGFSSSAYTKEDGIKVYRENLSSQSELQKAIFVKGNQVLVVPQYDISYLIYFENHV